MLTKFLPILRLIFATGVALSFTTSGFVHAETAQERAILNATYLSNLMHGAVADKLLVVVDEIASGKIQRLAPEQPVWIMEVIDGTILYYQGQESFKFQPANKLVDDGGQRFGLKAVEAAKAAKSTWITLKLGGEWYKAYCAAQYPTVTCSLVLN